MIVNGADLPSLPAQNQHIEAGSAAQQFTLVALGTEGDVTIEQITAQVQARYPVL